MWLSLSATIAGRLHPGFPPTPIRRSPNPRPATQHPNEDPETVAPLTPVYGWRGADPRRRVGPGSGWRSSTDVLAIADPSEPLRDVVEPARGGCVAQGMGALVPWPNTPRPQARPGVQTKSRTKNARNSPPVNTTALTTNRLQGPNATSAAPAAISARTSAQAMTGADRERNANCGLCSRGKFSGRSSSPSHDVGRQPFQILLNQGSTVTTVEVVHLRLGWILPTKPIHATRADVAHEQPAQAPSKALATGMSLRARSLRSASYLALSHPVWSQS